jgi:hypothetical protein|tara:strand:- start:5003 stop:5203 length:201 start_codon:yes stop_codon:yes gene_type:complete
MTLRTSTASEYYQEYYIKNKSRYKTYYKEKKEKELQNKLLFESYGGEVAFYRQAYIKFINQAKKNI